MKRQYISWFTGVALLASPAWAQDDSTADTATAPADTPPNLLEIWPDDRVYGDPDAPVTIFEFSSLTCPHCAAFHDEALPEIKTNLIDTGAVNIVIRHFPLDQLAMNAALVAECVPPAQYYPFIDVLYRTQEQWAHSDNPMQAVLQTAMLAGVPESSLMGCMQDESVLNGILAVRLRAQTELQISSTPTFFIGGQMIRGAQDYGTFADAVDVARAAMPAVIPADDEAEAVPEPEPATE